MSHDKYSVAWEPCMYGLRKYWNDNPFAVYFITNFLNAPIGANSIQIGEDFGWGKSMLRALDTLENMHYQNVIVMCEDYWATSKWNTEKILFLNNLLSSSSFNHIRLIPSGESKKESRYFYSQKISDLIVLKNFLPDALYKTSMNMGIWNINILKNLIKEKDNIWSFETEGRLRIEDDSKFFAVDSWDYVHYIHPDDDYFDPRWTSGAIEQGKWKESALKYAELEGIKLCNL